jgi:hypothetical protein
MVLKIQVEFITRGISVFCFHYLLFDQFVVVLASAGIV